METVTSKEIEEELGIKFMEKTSHLIRLGADHTFCGIPRIELYGTPRNWDGSLNGVCSKCQAFAGRGTR